MEAFIIASSIIAYLTVDLLYARHCFGKKRAEIIDNYHERRCLDPIKEFEREDRDDTLGYAFWSGAVWPVVAGLKGIGDFLEHAISGSTVKSAYEKDLESKEKDKRIAELEREMEEARKREESKAITDKFAHHNSRPDHIGPEY